MNTKNCDINSKVIDFFKQSKYASQVTVYDGIDKAGIVWIRFIYGSDLNDIKQFLVENGFSIVESFQDELGILPPLEMFKSRRLSNLEQISYWRTIAYARQDVINELIVTISSRFNWTLAEYDDVKAVIDQAEKIKHAI